MGWPPEPGESGERPEGGAFHYPADVGAWRDWLAANHREADAIWLVLPKKGSDRPGIALSDAVDEALCWGWIDSRPAKIDDGCWAVLVTPRRPGSVWSKVNKARVERLLTDGRIQPAGLAVIEAARRDGSWSRLDASDALELPADLVAALRADPLASDGFAAFPPSAKAPLLFWISDARRRSTRADRIRQVVEGARVGRSPLAWPRPPRD